MRDFSRTWRVLLIAAGARALFSTRDRDRAWALMLVSSLLLSPLGWMYYLPLAAGPLLAVARRSSMWTRGIIVAGCACLLVPPFFILALGAWGTLILGSIYTWACLLLFIGVSMAQASTLAEVETSATRPSPERA